MMRSRITRSRGILFVFATAVLTGCFYAAPQIAQQVKPAPAATAATQPAPDASINRPTSEPYQGDLSIFEDRQREANLQIGRVMDLLGIKESSRVADVGAGSGWFTVRAAKRVGPGGKVYAVEINKDYLKHIENRAAKEQLSNIETVLGAEDDPRLPANALDAALILKTYHEIAQPVRVLQRLKPSLRENALLGIIDRNGKGDDHGLDRDQVVREAERAGFVLVDQYDFVKPDGMDYFLIFRAAPASSSTTRD
ncbi:MAG: methyltransferase domain-containing protein [Pyrinomonadaceae bacterium]